MAMSAKKAPTLLSGQAAIDHMLRPGNSFLPLQDRSALLEFLELKLPDWIKEDAFACRNRIRDIEIAHRAELREAGAARFEAQEAYNACAQHDEIEDCTAEVFSLRKECEGRREFLAKLGSKGGAGKNTEGKAKGGRVVVTQDKAAEVTAALAEREAEAARRQAELDQLKANTPEWGVLEAAIAAEEELKTSLGLYAQKEKMAKAERQTGRNKGAAGSNFEESVRKIIYDCIIPLLEQEEGLSEEDWGDTVAVRSVSLGIAKGEIDYLIVRKPVQHSDGPEDSEEAVSSEGQGEGLVTRVGGHTQPLARKGTATVTASPVLVLAAVEVKQNPNDVGVVVDKYVERLSWMAGAESGYNATEMRTKFYPTGRFDRPFHHKDGASGETLVFDTSSFRLFARAGAGAGLEGLRAQILKRLHFVVKERSLIGMSSGVHRKLISIAGSSWDAQLGPDGRLLAPVTAAEAVLAAISTLAEAKALTTQALLRMYEEFPPAQRNVHVVCAPSSSSSPSSSPPPTDDDGEGEHGES